MDTTDKSIAISDFDAQDVRRNHLRLLLERRVIEYQRTKTKRERRKLLRSDFHRENVIGVELELLTTYLVGYASQIVTHGTIRDSEKAFTELSNIGIFRIPNFLKWYLSSEEDYPHVKSYADTLEYIRLLMIEYLKRQNDSNGVQIGHET